MGKIRSHEELLVFQIAFETAMEIFELTKGFPSTEKYSLIDQIRRSSRSVCGNIAEGFRKRRYPKSFIAKLIDSEGEAAETQVWLKFAVTCGYINEETRINLHDKYENIIGKLVKMGMSSDQWTY
jgi:four helix bundle protein